MRWLALETPDGAHVLPIGDVVQHTESGDCVARPQSWWTAPQAAPRGW